MEFSHWASVFLVGFSVLVLRTNSQGVCPNKWIHMQGSCYKFTSKALNWNAAKAACEALGSNLVVITSHAELQALTSKVSRNTWIGLHRDPKDKSRWLWVDGSRPTYTHWYKGEPNGLHEECAEMYPKVYEWKWNDNRCLATFPYVCETGVCPNGWINMQGSCYKFSSKALNWNAAKSACETLGSNLVVINSQAELQAIGAEITRYTWIGMYRDTKDKSRWLWVDGSRPTYTHWSTGEPNGLHEECAQMYPKPWKWNDATCRSRYRYVCETRVCPYGFIYMQGSCYKFSSKALNWNAAKSACETLGSNLVVINSQAELQAIGAEITRYTWIGMYRDPKAKSRWLWVDGSRPTYTHWSTGEPNGLHEECAQMYPKPWKWNDAMCRSRYRYVCETRANTCQKLSLRSGVQVSPSHCLSSIKKYGSTCSFSCAHGYQLSGPSSTQCGGGGAWSAQVNLVSCKDTNECSMSNGGCSHKCVNTAGGYKCECPDPGLSLGLDNRTCHAPGVDVQCNRDNMTITIPKSLLRGIDREHLRLLDTTCEARETSSYFSLTTPLTGCNTTRRQTPTAIVYSNTVLEIPVAAEDVVTRVREIEIQFSCFYSKYGVVSSVGWKPSNRKLVFSDEGKGNFTLSLNMFPDKRFVSPYTKDDFPVAVVLRKLLFFEASVTSGDKQLSIIADRCYATPTQDQKNSLKYEFIRKGCPNDVTVKYHPAPSVSKQRFSLEAFKFIADHPFVFVHCHVIVCNATDSGSKCAKKCPSSGRGRREVSDHMSNMYSLAQGPLHLAREKRGEKRGNGLDKSGSSPIFLMILFGMCVACLVGTVAMMYKKSRDKPAGYAMLVSGEKE